MTLDRKKEAIASEIENIKNGYANVLNEKKNAYEKYIGEVNGKCDDLRNEINDLENKKAIELSKLETYQNERKTALEDLVRSTRDYIDNITDQIEQLQDRSQELQDVHNKRVYNIKTQIASTMSEYDTLLRSRPELIKDAKQSGEDDLAARTKLFREKIDSLEKAHSEILAGLAGKRNDSIDMISKQIGELEIGKQNKLKQYEEEIQGLSQAYEAMLKDERDRQNSLNADIRKAKSEQEKFIDNMYNEDLNVTADYKEEKRRLQQLHETALKESADRFSEQSKALKESFDSLIRDRKILNAELASLVSEYKRIDDDISGKELELRYECNEKLLEVRKVLEEEQNRKKEKLSILDILNDDPGNIIS